MREKKIRVGQRSVAAGIKPKKRNRGEGKHHKTSKEWRKEYCVQKGK